MPAIRGYSSKSTSNNVFSATHADVLPDDNVPHEYINDQNLRQQRPMLPPRAPTAASSSNTLNRNGTLNTVSGGNGADQAYLRRDNDLDTEDEDDAAEDDAAYKDDNNRRHSRHAADLADDDYEGGGKQVVVESSPPSGVGLFYSGDSKVKEPFPKGVVIALVVAVIVIVLVVIGTVVTIIILFSRNYNKPYYYANSGNSYGYYQNPNGGSVFTGGMVGAAGPGGMMVPMYGNGMGIGMNPGIMQTGGMMGRQEGGYGNNQNFQ